MCRDGLGLGQPQGVERHVDLALETTHGVVLRAAVPQEREGFHHSQSSWGAAGAPAAATASATSTTGQSFHRRSSA